jgi:hypothetical protein
MGLTQPQLLVQAVELFNAHEKTDFKDRCRAASALSEFARCSSRRSRVP